MSIYCNPRRQRGDILLESLIGVLIAALAAGGIAHLLGRINDSQREAKVEQLALRQMRDDLHDKGLALCGTTPTLSLPGNLTPAIAVNCGTATAITLTLDAQTYTVTPPSAVTIAASASSLSLSGTSAVTLGTKQ